MRSSEILYVVGSLDVGGSERHLALITPGLKSSGWQPVIYCMTHRGVLADDLQRQGVEIIGPPLAWDSNSKVARSAALLASGIKLFVLLVRRRPAVVHFFLPMAYLIGAPVAILARVPVRAMSRRSLNYYQRNHPFLQRIELSLHPHMQVLLGNSRAVVTQLKTECARGPMIELIYNGIRTERFTPTALRTETTPKDKVSIIVVANLIAYKGHADLLRALATVVDQLPPKWELLCVGRDDGIGNDLVALSEQLGLRQHIYFLGPRQDVAELLTVADIGVLCSHEEGFSNAILEGMAAGLAMVVTNVGGNAEAVLDSVTGLVVPARDPPALGQAILALAQDSTKRAEMGRAARQRVASQFSLTECVRKYDALYRKLLDHHVPGALAPAKPK